MSKVFGKVFGEDKQKSSTPTGFQSLPKEAQDAFIDQFLGTGLEVFETPEQFDPSPFNNQITNALKTLNDAPMRYEFDGTVDAGDTLIEAKDALTDGTVQNAIDLSNNFLGDARGFISDGTSAISDGEFKKSFDRVYNPFRENVIDAFAADMKDEAAGIFSDLGQGATEAGAFGGTRQAVQEAELAGDVVEQIGRESARQRAAGFDFATSTAMQELQNLRNRQLQGGSLSISGASGAQQQGRLGIDRSTALRDIAKQAVAQRGQSRQDVIQNAQLQLEAGNILRNLEEAKRLSPFDRINFLGGVLGAFPTGGGQYSTASKTDGIAGFVSGILGGGKG